ncbi:MAG: Lar family restriction alleviation protein [Patescibacteria group bacterium]
MPEPLKECPFCGGTNQFLMDGEYYECECGATAPLDQLTIAEKRSKTPEELQKIAAAAWNRRTP